MVTLYSFSFSKVKSAVKPGTVKASLKASSLLKILSIAFALLRLQPVGSFFQLLIGCRHIDGLQFFKGIPHIGDDLRLLCPLIIFWKDKGSSDDFIFFSFCRILLLSFCSCSAFAWIAFCSLEVGVFACFFASASLSNTRQAHPIRRFSFSFSIPY